MVHLHNGMLYSSQKEGILTFHNSIDGTGNYYAKWNKPVSERQVPHNVTYKWSLMNRIN